MTNACTAIVAVSLKAGGTALGGGGGESEQAWINAEILG
jgi:hypothetical protein